jgi:nicotinate phosphoribosyltransferase
LPPAAVSNSSPATGQPLDGAGALFVDLYELTMLQAYFNEGMQEEAVFDLYVRSLPPGRNFLVACGLEQVLQYLEGLRFTADDLRYLESLRLFTRACIEHLDGFRFTGSVRAVREGSIVFPTEPLLEVKAPIGQAQLVETFLLNQVTFQTMIASKGARAVIAAQGRRLIDFGSRRAHGTDAAIAAARALCIAGYEATSNVAAGRRFGIPVAGTMAHSYVQAHVSEEEAFRRFLETYPQTVLLVDTYDSEGGLRTAAVLGKGMGERHFSAVRLDSGDLVELSKSARRILDGEGLGDVAIYASGGLDEEEIARLVAAGAPIDAFGVGTAAVVSADAPALDSAYKLVAYGGAPRMKLSSAKETLPGQKQVFREHIDGAISGDVIALAAEDLPGTPLLQPVMVDGRRTPAGLRSLQDARQHLRAELARLPSHLQSLAPASPAYTVRLSDGLAAAATRLRRELRETVQGQGRL